MRDAAGAPRRPNGLKASTLALLVGVLLVVGLIAVVLGNGGGGAPSGPARAADGAPGLLYITLGDSLGQGVQPDPARTLKGGYARELHATLRKRFGGAAWKNGACSGATTTSMIDASRQCNAGAPVEYSGQGPQGSQLAWAAALLRSRKDRPTVVSLTIGGNDVIECAGDDTVLLRRCLSDRTPALERNVETIARTLAQAAGSRTVLAVATSYDPTVAGLKADPARFTEPVQVFHRFITGSMNPTLRASFAQHGWLIADVGRAFGEHGPLPADAPVVRRVCRLTWACENGDIHPNDQGYAVIADLFRRTVEQPLAEAIAG